MSSPFLLFRRHQRILMVVITGLSMISFVLLGAVQDPRQLPAPLVIIFMAALAGGIAWLAGLNSGKATEWGLTATLIGAIVAFAATFYSNRQASAVVIDNGNLSAEQVSHLRSQRYIVNQFVHSAFQQTFNLPLQSLPAAIQRDLTFGFSQSGEVSVDDVVVGELLRRKADKMGIAISDKVVTDFIKQITSKSGLKSLFDRYQNQLNPQEEAMWAFYLPQLQENQMTAEAFTRLRQSLRTSETSLINAIRNELKIRQAYQLLSGNNYFPPEQFWQYYEQLNVKQSAEIATLPVQDFIDPDAKPSETDLLQLFEKYRQNFPGYTPEGRVAPGRPGFYQPRRFQLGYLEADYEQIEPLMEAVTDEEIQKAYEEKYLRAVPADGTSAAEHLDGPDLPPAPSTDQPAMPKADEKPAEKPSEASTEKKPVETPEKSEANDKPAVPTAEMPEKPATPQPESTPSSGETPAPKAPSTTKPATETPAPVTGPESKAAPEPESKTEEKPQTPEAPQPEAGASLLKQMPITQQVAFLLADDPAASAETPAEPATDKPADEPAGTSTEKPEAKPAESPVDKPEAAPADKPETKPDSETPAEKPAETPAPDQSSSAKPEEEKPATPAGNGEKPAAAGEMKAGETVVIPPAPSDETPSAPTREIPPLDDAMKATLRAEILKARTEEAIQKRIDAAYLEMSEISTDMTREKTEDRYLTLEQATQRLKKYAAENQLIYIVTPMLSQEELINSEEHPIGGAATPQRISVADSVARSTAADLYRVYSAEDFQTSSAYVFWKLQDKAAYAPVTLTDEPGLRDQVVEAWNLEQAYPKAQARAEELVKLIQNSQEPMGTVLAEQTVTGDKDSLFVPVRITGDFTWMQKPMVPATSMNQSMPVRPSIIPGATDAGEEFYQKVFNELQVGEVGIAPGNDHTNLYLVKIESRNPSTPEQLEAFRKKFIEEGRQVNGYSSLLQQSIMDNSVNWLQQLFDEHKVQIMQRD